MVTWTKQMWRNSCLGTDAITKLIYDDNFYTIEYICWKYFSKEMAMI